MFLPIYLNCCILAPASMPFPMFNAALFIARRYFVANPEKNRLFLNLGFIKILSGISMLAVCLGTAALVVVLSVFNGMENLTKKLFRQHNAEIRVSPAMGKSFVYADSLRMAIERVPGVRAITQVVEDNALLRYDDGQLVVKVKGVGNNFLEQYSSFDSAVVMGNSTVFDAEGHPQALLGVGIFYQLNVQLGNRMKALQFWYPKKGKDVNLNPTKAFQKKSILPGGVLSIEQQFDMNYVLVPLPFMRQLVDYEANTCSYLEICTTQKYNEAITIEEVQQALKAILGKDFKVENSEEQQASILKAVNIEKLFVFMAFLFLMGLASFNIFASLVILALEKRPDIIMLKSMGADNAFIRRIFLYEGLLIGGVGTVTGLLIGGVACFLQEEFGLISMGVESAIVWAYPVEIRWPDFILAGSVIFGITLLASVWPAYKAGQTETSRH